ncbi:CYFA0S20e00562g1_1 [Cyberlindnera fabianii]|uniref:CYFA0S20e00562g1_1 n=2 Tax=Cyberlindnera fabianii TaxID=36022 RepID=A0A061B7D8_CYBFA|nr:CYFA0S20e00562g1_1 [Cyberlindnera fabianii]
MIFTTLSSLRGPALRAPPSLINTIKIQARTMSTRSTLFARFQSQQVHKRSYLAGLSALTLISVGTYQYSNCHIVQNEIFKGASEIEPTSQLKPDPRGDTYENGLFIASQQELTDEVEEYRQERLNSRLGWLYKLRFMLNDYLIEPLITFGRFIELSCLFLPVLLFVPISYFGRRDPKRGNVRSGELAWYVLLRFALEHAGASFIKLGQWAASRTDIFTQQFCDELGNLHSHAKKHSLSHTKKILSSSFGGLPFDEIFEEFNEEPVGVGAIAQVYLATLSKKVIEHIDDFQPEKRKRSWLSAVFLNDSPSPKQRVAIKVMHPNVTTTIKRDLKIMMFFAETINALPNMEWLSLPDEVNNFGVLMNLQLDLRIEGLNLQKFQSQYKSDFFVNFPTPYLKFSNRSILVEEYINGISMSTMLELNAQKKIPEHLARQLGDKVLDSFLHMLIMENFIHSDLHPGNIFIRFVKTNELGTEILSSDRERDEVVQSLKDKPDLDSLASELMKLTETGYHPEVCYIDAGLVTELNELNRVNFIALFNSLAEFDGYKAGELMIERSKTPETAIDPEIFALKVERLVDKIKQRTFTLGTVSIGDLLEKMLSMVRSHHVRMEGEFVSVVVAILLLEGIGRQLDPQMDLFARFVWFGVLHGIPEH